jgi:DNA-binding transcriptional LysR family regulator
VVLAPDGHPLAAHDRLGLTDLADVPLLLEPPGTGFRDDLDADADRAGVVLEPQAEVDGMRLLASLAYQGFGAAILPASAMVDWTDGSWRAIPLDGTTRAASAWPSRDGAASPPRPEPPSRCSATWWPARSRRSPACTCWPEARRCGPEQLHRTGGLSRRCGGAGTIGDGSPVDLR